MANQTVTKAIRQASAAPSDDEIRVRAFQIWEARGRQPGGERDDWEKARKELSERPVVRAR